MPCRRIRTAGVPKIRHWTGFSRNREHPGNDGNGTTGLTSSHPKMPNLTLTPEEKVDVVAYILSLRAQH